MIPSTFVISLNEDLGKQEEALVRAGIYPILFKGVDGRKGEDAQYSDRLTTFCKHFCPGSMKGCGLSHILLSQHIYSLGLPLALVLEDDAYPIEKFDINREIDKVLTEVPDDWEIIKLHCDPWCKDGSNQNGSVKNGSAAAYLINTRGLEKLRNFKLLTHIDGQKNFTLNVYKSKVNLFWADEKTSTNRKDDSYYLSPVLDYLFPMTSGEKTYDHILSFKTIRIPFTNIELTNFQIFLCLLMLICLYLYSCL